MTTEWELLRQQFREAVLRRGEKTVEDLADETHVSRRTIYNLLADDVTPTRAVTRAAARFVERVCRIAQQEKRPDGG